MGLIDDLKAEHFTDREVPGVGAVRVRHLKTREMFEFTEAKDNNNVAMKRLVAATICDPSGSRLFASPDDVDQIDWAITRALSAAALDVNKLSAQDAEKNSTTPPSSP